MKNILYLFVVLFSHTLLFSAPSAVYDAYWDVYNNNNNDSINHSKWNDFLRKYTELDKTGIVLVTYSKVTSQDHQELAEYINTLSKTPILSYSKKEQRTYWINLYNALTVKLILDFYPISSIKEIYGGPLKVGPWNKKIITIENKEISLNDIEHRILRPLWKDSRVHFLVNCASKGCPNLLQQAITPQNYEQFAETAARSFISHTRGVSESNNVLVINSIFDWYSSDFGNNMSEILKYLNQYADDNTKRKLSSSNKITYEYDWSLNKVD
ncbi:MAG: DUF547 domain-containing protein [Brevinema sp.]